MKLSLEVLQQMDGRAGIRTHSIERMHSLHCNPIYSILQEVLFSSGLRDDFLLARFYTSFSQFIYYGLGRIYSSC